jgi:hypothetical protein
MIVATFVAVMDQHVFARHLKHPTQQLRSQIALKLYNIILINQQDGMHQRVLDFVEREHLGAAIAQKLVNFTEIAVKTTFESVSTNRLQNLHVYMIVTEFVMAAQSSIVVMYVMDMVLPAMTVKQTMTVHSV